MVARQEEMQGTFSSHSSTKVSTVKLTRNVLGLYERERLLKEQKGELKEGLKMEKEDFRSRKAAEYQKYLKQVADSSVRAKRRKEQLDKAKREAAIRAVEERIAIQRAKRLEERRKKAQEVVKAIEAEEFLLNGGAAVVSYELTGEDRSTYSLT